jgi:hypothetical protein
MTYSAVTCRAKGVAHALLSARQHIAAGAHRAANQDGLAGQLVVVTLKRMAGNILTW